MRVAFFTFYTPRGASSRYRVYQYLPWLARAGHAYAVFPFYTAAYDTVAGRVGDLPWLRKGWDRVYLCWGWLRRLSQVLRVGRYDAVFIQKELLSWPLFRLLVALNPRVIYDFDDAIYLSEEEQRRWIGWVTTRRGDVRVPRVLQRCRHVLVANEEAHRYALQFCPSVTKIVMPIDTDRFRPQEQSAVNGAVTLGWIGQLRNIQYLTALEDVFRRLRARHPQMRIKVVGLPGVQLDGIPVEAKPWRLEDEVDDMASFDIGLMPLSDDPWSRGKGGCKLIQYMAMGIVSVASPVGVNSELLRHGENGLAASTPEEWEQALERLIQDPALRRRFGTEGRRTAEALCALSRRAPEWVRIIESVGKSA